jgi:hypothetical protein
MFMSMQQVIYACDIGSTIPSRRTNTASFAWVRLDPQQADAIIGCSDMTLLVKHLQRDLQDQVSIALGIEAPLFIPVPQAAAGLSRSRIGEGNRSFAAPTGLAVTALALHQLAWLLRQLHPVGAATHTFTVDSQRWLAADTSPLLFCWEAFVSGAAHSDAHIRDAATAAVAFARAAHEQRFESHVTVPVDEPPLSTIGAAALWSGWTGDLAVLRQPALVIKPTEAFAGHIAVI